MLNNNSSYYFLIFIILGISGLAAIPSMLKAFSKTSDTYLMEEMKRVQTELMFYQLDNESFKNVCSGADFTILQNKALLESHGGISCTTNTNKTQLSLYTTLKSKEVYCVDSEGNQGIIDSSFSPKGRCSN